MATITYLGGQAPRTTTVIDQLGNIPRIEYSMSEQLYVRDAKTAPYLVHLQSLGTTTGWDDTYWWQEDAPVPEHGTIDGSASVGAVMLTVNNANFFTPQDLIYVPGVTTASAVGVGAQGLVTSVNTTLNTVVVAWLVPPTQVIVPGTPFIIYGNAYRQIQQINIMPTTLVAQNDNHFQDQRHGVQASELHVESRYRIRPGDWDLCVRKAGDEHDKMTEKTLIWGQPQLLSGTAISATPLGTCRGIYYDCLTMRTNLLGNPWTRTTWDNFLVGTTTARVGGGTNWIVLAASRTIRQVSQMAYTLERTDTDASQFGMAITKYKGPNNEVVKLIWHPLFDRLGFDDLVIMLNLVPEVVGLVINTRFAKRLYTSIQPWGNTAKEVFYRTVFTQFLKGEMENIAIAENVGP